tara:strand:+ start:1560 stop:2531 length:972 start_codon:yes stop_codon:yes gene_type:complete
MKNKLLTLASLLAAFNLNAIEIGPTGSGVEMSGFIDIQSSKQGDDTESTGAQVELNFGYSAGPVSAAVGLDFGAISAYGQDTTTNNLEEAYVTYDFGNGFSATAGRMLTYMGFEAFDPTGMYQFSYAYDVQGAQDIYDAYDTGMSIDYSGDAFSVGVWSSLENEAGYELALAYTGIENFTAKAIWSDFSSVTPDATVGAEADPYEKSTFWISYQLDKLLLAAEVAQKDSQGLGSNGSDVEGMMIMANYAATDSFAMTFRYSETEYETFDGAAVEYDGSKITISPSYVFTDSLSGLLEYSSYSKDSGTTAEPEELIAAELIFTF